jgi:hypothetical protein
MGVLEVRHEEGGPRGTAPNARLTPAGRKILVERIEAGMPIAHVADQMGVSRQDRVAVVEPLPASSASEVRLS